MYENLKNQFAKFRSLPFRAHQEELIEHIQNSPSKIIVIRAPTGFGKSLAAVCAGLLYKNFTYLVSSKPLQHQLQSDFPDLPIMMGRNNYSCLVTGLSADSCVHSRMFVCDAKYSKCEYEKQKRLVMSSPRRILNYSYFLYESNYVGRFSYLQWNKSTREYYMVQPNLIICDEGDLLDKLLADFISLSITPKTIKEFRIKPPKRKTADSQDGLESWKDWAYALIPRIASRVSYLNTRIDEHGKADDVDMIKDIVARKTRLENVQKGLDIFTTYCDDTWVLQSDSRGIVFRPVWIPGKLSTENFFKHADKFVLMSATFPPARVISKALGIPEGDIDMVEAPGTFPAKNRPTYLFKNAPNITRSTFDEEVPKAVKLVKRIINRHPDQKGLIHTVSYKLRDAVIQIDTDRFITHNIDNRQQIIDWFKESKLPLILISPSLERGLDLPGPECEFIIWCKAPFPSLHDKIVSKRLWTGGGKHGSIGRLWYRSTTAQTIEQGCGRGMRQMSDRCTVYIIDEQAKKMIVREPSLFSRYFLESVEFIDNK